MAFAAESFAATFYFAGPVATFFRPLHRHRSKTRWPALALPGQLNTARDLGAVSITQRSPVPGLFTGVETRFPKPVFSSRNTEKATNQEGLKRILAGGGFRIAFIVRRASPSQAVRQ